MAKVAIFAFSDLHLTVHNCRTRPYPSVVDVVWQWMLGVARRKPAQGVLHENEFDDFPITHERAFVDLLDLLIAQHAHCDEIHIVLNGDIHDLLVVPDDDGVYKPVGREEDAVEKTQRSVSSNPITFGALRRYLGDQRVHVIFTVGNHDMELNWLKAQDVIIETLTSGDVHLMSRLRFVDYRDGYYTQIGLVGFHHGHSSDFLNKNPEPPFLTSIVDGTPRMIPSPGALSVTEVVQPVRALHSAMGREVNAFRTFMYYLVHDLEPGLYTEWRNLVYQVKLFMVAIRNLAFLQFLKIIYYVNVHPFTTDAADKPFAQRMIQEKGCKVLFMGHTHRAGMYSLEGGLYINTGTWSKLSRYVTPSFSLTWYRYKGVEYFWRCLLHYVRSRERVVWSILMTLFPALFLYYVGKWWFFGYLFVTACIMLGRIFTPKPHIEEMILPTFGLAQFDEEKPDETLVASLYVQDSSNPQGYRQFIG